MVRADCTEQLDGCLDVLTYDTHRLLSQYEQLPASARIAFTASCAERLWVALERCPGPLTTVQITAARDALDRSWSAAHTGQDAGDWEDVLAAVIPSDDRPDWEGTWAFTQDALIAIAYAMQSTRASDVRLGEWAARQVYNSADQAAQFQRRDLDLNVPGAEALLLAMPVLQVALRGIADDLDLAARHPPAEVADLLRPRAAREAPALADLLTMTIE